jgi:hypothetical protein
MLTIEVGEDEIVGITEEAGVLEVELELVARTDGRYKATVDLLATEGLDLCNKTLGGDIPLVSDLERHALMIQSFVKVPRVDLTPHLVPFTLEVKNNTIGINVSN